MIAILKMFYMDITSLYIFKISWTDHELEKNALNVSAKYSFKTTKKNNLSYDWLVLDHNKTCLFHDVHAYGL